MAKCQTPEYLLSGMLIRSLCEQGTAVMFLAGKFLAWSLEHAGPSWEINAIHHKNSVHIEGYDAQ